MEFDDLHVEISGTHTVQEEHDSSGNNTPTHAPPSNAAPGTVAVVPKSSNVFIAGLPSTWGTSRLKDLLQPFGTLVSVRVVSDRHYAFAQFSTVEAAQACIKALHDTKVSPSSNTTLHVCFAIHSEGTEEVPNSRLFVRGLPPFATKEDLRRIGAPFGVVVDASVIVHPDGKCKGSGFIAFDDVDAATACLTRLSGKLIPFGDPLQPQARGCELVFKYCETDEQRAMRIKSNKDRINRRPPSVASTTPSSGLHRDGALESPHPQTAIAAFGIGARSILPSTETNTIGRSGTPQSGSSRRVRQHDNPLSVDIVVPSAPVAVNTLFLRAPTPAFPRGGDVLMTAPSLTAQQARELMAGVIDAPLLVCPFRNGFALRLSKPELHQVALDALHETVFANGERLRVELLITA